MNAFDWRAQPLQTALEADKPKRGRPRLYDDEERRERHRAAALKWYRKQQARRAPCYFAVMGEAARAQQV